MRSEGGEMKVAPLDVASTHDDSVALDVDPAHAPARVGPFTRFICRYPEIVAGVIFVATVGFVVGVGFPALQQGFEGYDAISSHTAQVADGLEYAVREARSYMRGAADEEEVTGLKYEPLTQELGAYTTLFFFHSKSGKALSEASLKSAMNVLNGATDIIGKDFCWREKNEDGTAGDKCRAPLTLMEQTKEILEQVDEQITKGARAAAAAQAMAAGKPAPEVEAQTPMMDKYDPYDPEKLKQAIKDGDDVPGLPQLLRVFMGKDLDSATGSSAWMKGFVRLGGPLPNYHNFSHNEGEQRKLYDKNFQKRGLLGPEPTDGGWIKKFDKLIADEQVALPQKSPRAATKEP